MKKLFLLFALFSPVAFSAPFVEIGIGAPLNASPFYSDCLSRPGSTKCSPGNLGYVAVGYTWRGFSIQLDHYSSVATSKDRGLNVLAIKYRHEFK